VRERKAARGADYAGANIHGDGKVAPSGMVEEG
jgi:hypothetical protein